MTNEWEEPNLTEEEILCLSALVLKMPSHTIFSKRRLHEYSAESWKPTVCERSPHTQVFIRASMEITLPRISQIYIQRLLW